MSGPLLITGAQGFIGRWTAARALRDDSLAVVGLGRSPRLETFTHQVALGVQRVPAPLTPELVLATPRYTYLSVDIRDVEALDGVIRTVRPSVIVHLASALRDEPIDTLFSVNVQGTFALLEAVARCGVDVERLILASSGSVYGAPASLPVTETQPAAPADLYAVSKLAAEHVALVAARDPGIPLIIARIFNVVGAGLDERHACARFASQLAAVALGRRLGPVVVGDLSPTRDIVDVRDVADALLLLSERGMNGTIYNVGSGHETSMRTVFDILATLAGGSIATVEGYSRAGDTRRAVADISRLTELGWASRYALSDSLADLFAYYAGPVVSESASLERTLLANASATFSPDTQG